MNSRRAFTLLELLVVMAILGLLAALLLPTMAGFKKRAQRTTCRNNLRQINLGLRQYCDDAKDSLPTATRGLNPWDTAWNDYRALVKDYVGLKGQPSPKDRLFACPADTFYVHEKPQANGGGPYFPFLVRSSLHDQTNFNYSSYAFNGGITNSVSLYTNHIGIGDRKLSSIRDPAKTAFVTEAPALYPYSWHEPGNSSTFGAVTFNNGAVYFTDAKNMVSFVDGHVSYIKIYWDPGPIRPGVWSMAYQYDPPAGYDYKWSGD